MTVRRKGNFEFKKNQARLKRVKPKLPRIIGNIAVNFFKENFRKGGFVDRSLKRWEKRVIKARTNRGILVQSGALKRSIKIIRATFRRIVVGSEGVPYASTHNFGETITAKGDGKLFIPLSARASRKRAGQNIPKEWVWGVDFILKDSVTIPERKIVGDSVQLEKKIEKRLVKELDKVFK